MQLNVCIIKSILSNMALRDVQGYMRRATVTVANGKHLDQWEAELAEDPREARSRMKRQEKDFILLVSLLHKRPLNCVQCQHSVNLVLSCLGWSVQSVFPGSPRSLFPCWILLSHNVST